jgi:hypothetical protein
MILLDRAVGTVIKIKYFFIESCNNSIIKEYINPEVVLHYKPPDSIYVWINPTIMTSKVQISPVIIQCPIQGIFIREKSQERDIKTCLHTAFTKHPKEWEPPRSSKEQINSPMKWGQMEVEGKRILSYEVGHKRVYIPRRRWWGSGATTTNRRACSTLCSINNFNYSGSYEIHHCIRWTLPSLLFHYFDTNIKTRALH